MSALTAVPDDEDLGCARPDCANTAPPVHTPCCSAHRVPLCCEHFCIHHHVELHPCDKSGVHGFTGKAVS